MRPAEQLMATTQHKAMLKLVCLFKFKLLASRNRRTEYYAQPLGQSLHMRGLYLFSWTA